MVTTRIDAIMNAEPTQPSLLKEDFSSVELRRLTLVAYITIAGAGAVGIFDIQSTLMRWGALALLIMLAVARERFWLAREADQNYRSHLFLTLGIGLVCALLAVVPGSFYFPIIFFVLSVDVMLAYPLRTAGIWIIIICMITGVNFVYAFGWLAGLQRLVPYACGYFFFAVFTNSLYRARIAQMNSERYLEHLHKANRQLQEYAERIETLTKSQERTRLAREMHDTVGHHLTVAAVQVEGAQRLIDGNPQKAASMLGTVRAEIGEALKEIRHTVSQLRQPSEADLPIDQAIRRMAADFQNATGLTISVETCQDMPRLPYSHHMALYRTAQEGLTNVQRHAQAKHAWLRLDCRSDEIWLILHDDGRGFPGRKSVGGFGLLGIQERAAQLGGKMTVQPFQRTDPSSGESDEGTLLVFSLPLPKGEDLG